MSRRESSAIVTSLGLHWGDEAGVRGSSSGRCSGLELDAGGGHRVRQPHTHTFRQCTSLLAIGVQKLERRIKRSGGDERHVRCHLDSIGTWAVQRERRGLLPRLPTSARQRGRGHTRGGQHQQAKSQPATAPGDGGRPQFGGHGALGIHLRRTQEAERRQANPHDATQRREPQEP